MINTVSISTPIGFIGLGVIGGAMATNLLKAGYKVMVHNKSKGKVDELTRIGAVDGTSSVNVARNSKVIFICVPDTPDVERVLFGDEGIVHGIERGSVVIDCSTISATATVEFSARLKTVGVEMLDSPVSGGLKGAQDGTLSCMIGGDPSVVEACMPLFRAVGKTFTHVGANGAGQACKACNQMVLVGTLMAVSEAFALAGKMNIDPQRVREALLGGSAQSFVLANHGKKLLDGALTPGFRGKLMLKDIKLALGAGRDTGSFMPVTALGAQMLAALCNTGRGELDSAALGLLFRELSGLKT
ncbi:MAG: NAD(P)-dependent oxidoreductase [Gallionellaceae bacterium]|nr:NAD(P)-dependent oxidoreductase [Gallionellaceae bacterium]